MNATPNQGTPATERRPRAWVGWAILGVATAAIGVSFLVGGDPPPATTKDKRVTPVTAVAVVRGEMVQRARFPGELDADAVDIAAFYAGRVTSIKVRVGDTVEANAVLAELDPIDAREQIAQARAQAKAAAAERNRAKVERDAAVAEVARLEPLAKDQLISALEIDRQRARAGALAATVETAAAGEAEAQARVKLLEKRLVESVVRAPFAGRIAERYVDPGATVASGSRLVRIVAVAPLWIRFEVPEAQIARVTKGSTLTAVARSGDGTGTAARVTGVASEISRDRRIAIVEALIEKPREGWLPGMYAEAIVELRTIRDATIVPANAVLSRLQPDGKVAVGVLIAGDGGVARWVAVTEVARDEDRVAVEGQLPVGTKVLVTGHVDLGDGSQITVGAAR
jgi:RND family efflux transporter MFP subunit